MVGCTEADGGNATSYKAAVAHDNRQFEDRREGQQGRYRGPRGGDKGKGIARDKQVPYKHESPYHPYREKFPRGYGEGSSVHGRHVGYGDRRKGVQARGSQQSRVGEGAHLPNNREKLMFDAFKGAPRSPVREVSQMLPAAGNGSTSKACKALVFEEPALEPLELVPGKAVDAIGEMQILETHAEGVEEPKVSEELLHSQALDEANLMIEGVLLSDSDLLLEEGGEVEDWEQGEIMDFTEEQDSNLEAQGSGDNNVLVTAKVGDETLVEMKGQIEGDGENPKKKKSGQNGIDTTGGAKKRAALVFISPRKKLLAKAGVKPGEKGTKKASTKPKNPSE
ncbi:hypothetical protein Bca101_059364 [Brassica carinata]